MKVDDNSVDISKDVYYRMRYFRDLHAKPGLLQIFVFVCTLLYKHIKFIHTYIKHENYTIIRIQNEAKYTNRSS